MKPTLGRIVHYTNLGDADGRYPPEQQAAVITAVKLRDQFHPGQPPPDIEEDKYVVTLHVFYKTGQFDMEAPFSAEYRRGHWSWPPRAGGV